MADLPILDELRRDLREAGRRTERPRLPWRPFAAVAAAGLAAVFVVVAGPSEPAIHSSAGAETAPLTHVVYTEQRVRDGRVRTLQRTQQWLTADRCRARAVVERPDGTSVAEFVEGPDEVRSWTTTDDVIAVSRRDRTQTVGVVDPSELGRTYLQKHPSRIVGRTERDGRALVWRAAKQPARSEARYLTPLDSYEVLEVRMLRDGKELARTVVEVREEVAFDELLLTMSRHAGATTKRRSISASPAPGAEPPRCG